ncbi:MAG: hypothetical protein JWP00_3224 [Chloroflexi bacterium]|nr:hypothetical protein [Chloroflexota bacterium]
MANPSTEIYDTPLVLTLGHSTRSLDDFIKVLWLHGVTCLADVRTMPRSRHNPQFNFDSLPGDLKEAGIGYEHIAALGGLRKARAESPNTGWRNKSFQGYADYMLTPEFEAGLQHLINLAGRELVAIMCAEAVPWRCHRSLIGDALLVHGIRVGDIIGEKPAAPHKLTAWAQIKGTGLLYPATPEIEFG